MDMDGKFHIHGKPDAVAGKLHARVGIPKKVFSFGL